MKIARRKVHPSVKSVSFWSEGRSLLMHMIVWSYAVQGATVLIADKHVRYHIKFLRDTYSSRRVSDLLQLQKKVAEIFWWCISDETRSQCGNDKCDQQYIAHVCQYIKFNRHDRTKIFIKTSQNKKLQTHTQTEKKILNGTYR